MLTPSFNISQNEEYLFVNIHAPYTQLKEVEINVLESVLWFYSSPYFLRYVYDYRVTYFGIIQLPHLLNL